jgi:hypothetical protein
LVVEEMALANACIHQIASAEVLEPKQRRVEVTDDPAFKPAAPLKTLLLKKPESRKKSAALAVVRASFMHPAITRSSDSGKVAPSH